MSATDSLLFATPPARPDFSVERALYREGFKRVAGIDEAGRGPLAGPVVAAAVVLDRDRIPDGLNDSKKLSDITREALFAKIIQTADVAWVSLPSRRIDAINIREAALEAMTRSANGLNTLADVALIDGRDVPSGLVKTGRAMVKGDARSLSIAAASIVAKVIRDRMMKRAALHYPDYGFEKHKGYGSKAHRDAIARFGPCPLHRMSFSPMRER